MDKINLNTFGSFLYQLDEKSRSILEFIQEQLLYNAAIVLYRMKIAQKILSFGIITEDDLSKYAIVPGFRGQSHIGTVLTIKERTNFEPLINFVPVKITVDNKTITQENNLAKQIDCPICLQVKVVTPWINEYKFVTYLHRGNYRIEGNEAPIHIKPADSTGDYTVIQDNMFTIEISGCYEIYFELLDDTFTTIITRELDVSNDIFGEIINPTLINFFSLYIPYFGLQGGYEKWLKLWHYQIKSYFDCLDNPNFYNIMKFFNSLFGFKYKYAPPSITPISNSLYYSGFANDEEMGNITRWHNYNFDYFDFIDLDHQNVHYFLLFVDNLNFNFVESEIGWQEKVIENPNFKITTISSFKHSLYSYKQPRILIINGDVLFNSAKCIFTPVYNLFILSLATIRNLLPSNVPLGVSLFYYDLGTI